MARNNVNVLLTEEGETLTDPFAIKREAVNYFQRFMKSQPDSVATSDMEDLQELLSYRCFTTEASMLVAAFTPEEIHKTLLSLPNGTVPGLDSYTKEFFVAVWPIVGRDLVVAIQSFFQFGFLPTGVNSTILALIPKKTPAQTMKDFRPIACCNLIYKVISKLLFNRLKMILPSVIEPNQCAFIKGRLLMENICLANELVKGYHLISTSDRSTVKFDIFKAFDNVKWGFIVYVLQAMGLPIHSLDSSTYLHCCFLSGYKWGARGVLHQC